MIFKFMYLIDLNVSNLMECLNFAYKLQLHYNTYMLVFTVWTIHSVNVFTLS